MSIKDFPLKIKSFLTLLRERAESAKDSFKIKEDAFVAILFLCVGLVSFGLGKLSAMEKNTNQVAAVEESVSQKATEKIPVSINTPNKVKANPIIQANQSGIVLASKNGTRYYYPWCSGVSRIKEENKVWFNSIEEAESAGLTLAANCSGSQ